MICLIGYHVFRTQFLIYKDQNSPRCQVLGEFACFGNGDGLRRCGIAKCLVGLNVGFSYGASRFRCIFDGGDSKLNEVDKLAEELALFRNFSVTN